MTALHTIVTPLEGIEGATFGVVADDTTAHYVYTDRDIDGLDDERIANIAQMVEVAPTTALMWLQLACSNLSYFTFTAPVEEPDMDSAIAAATSAIDVALATRGSAESREDHVAYQRVAAQEWARLYPEAAAGDVDDPDADLALAQTMRPPVDPTRPHEWLPIAAGEDACGFCDQPIDHALHSRSAPHDSAQLE